MRYANLNVVGSKLVAALVHSTRSRNELATTCPKFLVTEA